jgi:hypothetical protein
LRPRDDGPVDVSGSHADYILSFRTVLNKHTRVASCSRRHRDGAIDHEPLGHVCFDGWHLSAIGM